MKKQYLLFFGLNIVLAIILIGCSTKKLSNSSKLTSSNQELIYLVADELEFFIDNYEKKLLLRFQRRVHSQYTPSKKTLKTSTNKVFKNYKDIDIDFYDLRLLDSDKKEKKFTVSALWRLRWKCMEGSDDCEESENSITREGHVELTFKKSDSKFFLINQEPAIFGSLDPGNKT